MNQGDIQSYLGNQVELTDWYHILIQPGTPGRVTSVIKTHQQEWYIRVRLHDLTRNEELYTPEAFHRMFRVVKELNPDFGVREQAPAYSSGG